MISNQSYRNRGIIIKSRNSLNLDCGKTKGISLESISIDNLKDQEKSEYVVGCTNTLVEDNNPFLDFENLYALYTDLFANLHLQGDLQDYSVVVPLYSDSRNETQSESELEFANIEDMFLQKVSTQPHQLQIYLEGEKENVQALVNKRHTHGVSSSRMQKTQNSLFTYNLQSEVPRAK
jgi:hypothetical protein